MDRSSSSPASGHKQAFEDVRGGGFFRKQMGSGRDARADTGRAAGPGNAWAAKWRSVVGSNLDRAGAAGNHIFRKGRRLRCDTTKRYLEEGGMVLGSRTWSQHRQL
jgi:hypothetical protein